MAAVVLDDDYEMPDVLLGNLGDQFPAARCVALHGARMAGPLAAVLGVLGWACSLRAGGCGLCACCLRALRASLAGVLTCELCVCILRALSAPCVVLLAFRALRPLYRANSDYNGRACDRARLDVVTV